jgi:hypothetical protein
MPELTPAQFAAAMALRDADFTNRHAAGVGEDKWEPDGVAANIWKRKAGVRSSGGVASPPPSRVGSTTNLSPTVTGLATPGTSGLISGLGVSGAGIPAGTKIQSVGPTNITLTQNASATGTPVLTFDPGADYVERVEFGVDLKLGSSAPPNIRPVDLGPNDQAAGNEARNRAIRMRDKLKGGGD